MTLRTAVWTGSSGASWPALSSGDTWATSFWVSPTVDAAQLQAGPTAAVDGAGKGYITATHNLSPLAFALGSGTYTTAASTASRYTFTVGSAPFATGVGAVNLIFVSTTWTASHYHTINSAACTNGWSGLTYDKVTDYVYNIGAVYYCLSVFRTTATSAGTDGNIAVDIYSTSTSALIATQATGGTFNAVAINGVDTTSNGANAIRTANTTTATSTTGQPAVTLPNNLLRYSSLPIMFCSHGTSNTMGSNSSDAALIQSGSYATPSNGVALTSRLVPSTVATVKTQRTMTANFGTATTGWGAIGIEVLDSSTNDTYTDRTRDYSYVRIASNTSQPAYQTSEVRAVWSAGEGNYGPHHGMIGRYVTSGGTKYWIGASLRLDGIKGYGNAYIYSASDNGTTSSVTQLAATSGPANPLSTVTASAMRVRVQSNGDLWISAKWWVNGASEPAWPTTTSPAETTISASPVYAIVNTTYITSDALRNATSGQTGLYYLYPAASSTTTLSGSFIGPTEGANTATWSSWSNDAWVESTTGSASGAGAVSGAATRVVQATAAITGSGTTSGTATVVVPGTASVAGTETTSATACVVVPATASVSATSSVASAAVVVPQAAASIATNSTITSSANVVRVVTSSVTSTGSLTASAVAVATLAASISAVGSLTAVASVEVRATITGSGWLTATGTRVVATNAVVAASSALAATAVTYAPLPSEVRITSTAKVGTGLVSSNKVGTGTTSTLKVGTGLTHTEIKEVI